MSFLLLKGNSLRIPLADRSVQCCVTSPPYWGLRDYGTATWEGGDERCDHQAPDEAGKTSKPSSGQRQHAGRFSGAVCWWCGARRIDLQLGLEPTPEAYVSRMVEVFREVKRVLRDDGTCFCNMGDSFLPSKQLAGVPWMLAFALQRDGWILRSDIIWSKGNPMPESVTDRPTKAHEYIFLLAKQDRYFWDAEAVREPHARIWDAKTNGGSMATDRRDAAHIGGSKRHERPYPEPNPSGRNVRSVWTINPEPFAGAHFATFPRALVERCIKAGTSERGCCAQCGKCWERVTESERVATRPGLDTKINGHSGATIGNRDPGRHCTTTTTLGFRPTCSCPESAPVPCVVLDPFMGSGTVAVVAEALKRNSVGVELSADYLDIARRRLERPHAPVIKSGRVEHYPLFADQP